MGEEFEPAHTTIQFFGVLPAKSRGDARKGCVPTDPKAESWHITVGGTQCSINGIEDFAKHVGDMLRLAYQAGQKDSKSDIRQRLGLSP